MSRAKPSEGPNARPLPEKTDWKHCDEMLDEALEESFPASDPPAITVPSKRSC
jgi:hypothetical protein